jgi:thiol-disulfide isomerase/thioredoxin
MKRKLLLTGIFILIVHLGFSQSIEIIDVQDMQNIIDEDTDKTKVINFWATWCKPCIEELPYFEAVNANPEFENVEVILISLDFVEDLNTRVMTFVEKKELKSTIKLLDDVDYNSWIDKVDPSWSGAIPATLLVNTQADKRMFFEKQFKDSELDYLLKNFEMELTK